MILKILSRHAPNYRSLINYIIDHSKDKDGNEHFIAKNFHSNTREGFERELIANEVRRLYPRSNQVYMFHEIIAFSTKEDNSKITNEMLLDLAQEYAKMRGNALYIIGIHRNTDSAHFHCLTSATEYITGRSMRLSKKALLDLKNKLTDYQKTKYPQLIYSCPEHGKRSKEWITDNEWQLLHRDERKSIKAEVTSSVNECFTKAKTQKEFLELLRDDHNLHFYERAGTATGLVLDSGIKIRFSRLGISKEQFLAKPLDRSEEIETLLRIRRLRDTHKSLSKDINQSREDG